MDGSGLNFSGALSELNQKTAIYFTVFRRFEENCGAFQSRGVGAGDRPNLPTQHTVHARQTKLIIQIFIPKSFTRCCKQDYSRRPFKYVYCNVSPSNLQRKIIFYYKWIQ